MDRSGENIFLNALSVGYRTNILGNTFICFLDEKIDTTHDYALSMDVYQGGN